MFAAPVVWAWIERYRQAVFADDGPADREAFLDWLIERRERSIEVEDSRGPLLLVILEPQAGPWVDLKYFGRPDSAAAVATALGLVMSHVWEQTTVGKVVIQLAPESSNQARMLKGLGFRQEAYLPHHVMRGGKPGAVTWFGAYRPAVVVEVKQNEEQPQEAAA